MIIVATHIDDVWVIFSYVNNRPEIYKDVIFTSKKDCEAMYDFMKLNKKYIIVRLEEYIDRVIECE